MTDWVWFAIIAYIGVGAFYLHLYRNNNHMELRIIEAVMWPVWVALGMFLWLIYKLIKFIIWTNKGAKR